MIEAMGAGYLTASMINKAQAEEKIYPAWQNNYLPKELSFDPTQLKGLSEKLISSHWKNNYIGSVKALNMIKKELYSKKDIKGSHPLIYAGLKREEILRNGSVYLHELYFDILGGSGEISGEIETLISIQFGSFEAWKKEFILIARGLSGGSGWVSLSINPFLGKLENFISFDHTQNPPMNIPLVALDMYEHSYHIDYGTSVNPYIEAFINNLDWNVVNKNLDMIKI